jgi:hypothetical protein
MMPLMIRPARPTGTLSDFPSHSNAESLSNLLNDLRHPFSRHKSRTSLTYYFRQASITKVPPVSKNTEHISTANRVFIAGQCHSTYQRPILTETAKANPAHFGTLASGKRLWDLKIAQEKTQTFKNKRSAYELQIRFFS